MRLFLRIVLFFVTLATIVCVFFAVYVRTHGKDILVTSLEGFLKRKVLISDVSFQFPFGLKFDNFILQDVFESKEVFVQFDPVEFLSKRTHIKSFVVFDPQVDLNQLSVHFLASANQNGASAQSAVTQGALNVSAVPWLISVDRLEAYNASFNYRQHLPDRDRVVGFKNAHVVVENIKLPIEPQRSSFELRALLVQNDIPSLEGLIEASGWVELIQKNMKVHVNLTDKDHSNSLTSDIVSVANQVTVSADADLKTDSLKALTQSSDPSVRTVVFGVLGQLGSRVGAHFSFKTQMDQWDISNITFSVKVLSPETSSWKDEEAQINSVAK